MTRPGASVTTRSGMELIPLQVSKADAAKLLGYSVRTIERMIALGQLATRGRGRLLRVDYQSILEYQARSRGN